ncbi:MAG TPA: ATP synthase F0 subunit B [Candidatus Binataceae bacterium]|nr:ATP synthase F0 subunit B [Candidatus Binataceae bacterium]
MHIPPNWGTYFTLIVSFLVFWFIFSRLFFRPFLNLLAQREDRFRSLSERTEQLIREARTDDDEREKRIAEIRRDAIAMRETHRRAAEAEAAQLMEAAKAQTHAALEAARAKIESELAAAEQQLEAMSHNLGAELAVRILGRPVDGAGAGESNN